jgi:hypothetical protein
MTFVMPMIPTKNMTFDAFDDADGQRIFFKIDYRDRSLLVHSPDAADASVTQRVITIMLADD